MPRRLKVKQGFRKTCACWTARETNQGWRVSFWAGDDHYNLSGLLLQDPEDVKLMLGQGVVFIHMKERRDAA